jgi:hypothetical protein
MEFLPTTAQRESSRLASLLFDAESQHFFVHFRYGDRSFKRSLGTDNEKLALALRFGE